MKGTPLRSGSRRDRTSSGRAVPVLISVFIVAAVVRVRGVSAPNAEHAHPCTLDDFTVDQVSSGIKITLAARATSTLSSLGLPRATWPAVGMLERSVDQDGCKGASLTLGYAASGTLAQ